MDIGRMDLQYRFASKPAEQRRHQRVAVTILGRYMLADKREFRCQTIDMSPGGVHLSAPVRGNIGERIIVYLDEIGRIEGNVVRLTERGFALAMNLPFIKREMIANQLTWIVNRNALGLPEARRHERIVPHHRHSHLHVEDGREFPVKLIDISVSGAAMTAPVCLPIGTRVRLGQTAGQVIRILEDGFAIIFEHAIPIDRFDENITL